MIRRVLLGVVLMAFVAAGCSSSSDTADATTTAPTTTTTTKPEITKEELVAQINDRLRPTLEGVFEPTTVDCVIGVLQDAATGELNADDSVAAYEDRCHVTATQVTGVIAGAALVDRGADEAAGACVAQAIGKMTYDQAAALSQADSEDVYRACGIDIEALGG